MKLLHIDSSILGENAASRPLTAAVVDRLRQENQGIEVTYRDLAAEPLPHLTLSTLPAGDLPPDADADLRASHAALNEFLAADTVVIGAPMYNFSVPSQLKVWIDRILVAGKTFRYTANGPEGLAGGKQVVVVVSRGGFYGTETPNAAAEHAETYLRTVFAHIGITDVTFIIAEGLQVSPETREAALDAAMRAASSLPSVTASVARAANA